MVRITRASETARSGGYRPRVDFLGWGVFNLLEGIVNHQLLGIRHVWLEGPGSVLLWDAGFLLSDVLFIVGGYAVI